MHTVQNLDDHQTRSSGTAALPLSAPGHALTAAVVCLELDVDPQDGLTTTEALNRLERHGRNELDGDDGVQPVKILVRQLANAMMLVLIAAMAVSFGIGSYIEGGVIAAVIILNVVVGFIQEYKAETTMDSLRSLSSPTAATVRDGKTEVVPTGEVVPGDLVELKAGDTVPADIRSVVEGTEQGIARTH